MEKDKIHYAPAYFQNPLHRISVTLIGGGGNGSQMLSALARMDHAMRSMERKGLSVTLWDADTVEETNIGRQLFAPCELGLNKAQALISRINRYYGLDWSARNEMFKPDTFGNSNNLANIIISCVDNIDIRKAIGKNLSSKTFRNGFSDEHKLYYWMDLGNGRGSGQVYLGSTRIQQPSSRKYQTVDKLPFLTEEVCLDKRKEKNSGPSCSMAESLKKQDLFINSSLVQMASSLLWNLLIKCYTQNRGCYLNLTDLSSVPVKL